MITTCFLPISISFKDLTLIIEEVVFCPLRVILSLEKPRKIPLLRGNAKSGFTRMPSIKGTHNFVSMAKFKDKIYLASHGGGWDVGAYVYENNTLTKLVTGLTPETQHDAHTVTCTDEDLWIVGLKDILHFDGSAWERIDFPGNPPIR